MTLTLALGPAGGKKLLQLFRLSCLFKYLYFFFVLRLFRLRGLLFFIGNRGLLFGLFNARFPLHGLFRFSRRLLLRLALAKSRLLYGRLFRLRPFFSLFGFCLF